MGEPSGSANPGLLGGRRPHFEDQPLRECLRLSTTNACGYSKGVPRRQGSGCTPAVFRCLDGRSRGELPALSREGNRGKSHDRAAVRWSRHFSSAHRVSRRCHRHLFFWRGCSPVRDGLLTRPGRYRLQLLSRPSTFPMFTATLKPPLQSSSTMVAAFLFGASSVKEVS